MTGADQAHVVVVGRGGGGGGPMLITQPYSAIRRVEACARMRTHMRADYILVLSILIIVPWFAICVRLRARLRVRLRARLSVRLRARLSVRLRARLRVRLRARLRVRLRARVRFSLIIPCIILIVCFRLRSAHITCMKECSD